MIYIGNATDISITGNYRLTQKAGSKLMSILFDINWELIRKQTSSLAFYKSVSQIIELYKS